MRKLLITGQSGFVGQHVLAHLEAGKAPAWQAIAPMPHDLLDPDSLDAWLTDQCPDAVIHLAGQTFVPTAFRDPEGTLRTNLLGTLNLLQALKRRGFQGIFLYVSSGDVYGQVDIAQLPITETLLPRPRNPYAVSKLAAEHLCLQWSFTEPGWRILIARPFNHVGPGQAETFLIPDMAHQLVRVRKGLQTPELLDKGRSGEIYNVCSGTERNIRELILQMADLAGLEITLKQDSDRLRRAEQRRVAGSCRKLREETGWQASITVTTMLNDVLGDWEKRE